MQFIGNHSATLPSPASDDAWIQEILVGTGVPTPDLLEHDELLYELAEEA